MGSFFYKNRYLSQKKSHTQIYIPAFWNKVIKKRKLFEKKKTKKNNLAVLFYRTLFAFLLI